MRRQGVTNRKARGSCFEKRLFCVRKKRGITTLKDRGHNIFSLTYVPEYFELFEFISDALSLSAKSPLLKSSTTSVSGGLFLSRKS